MITTNYNGFIMTEVESDYTYSEMYYDTIKQWRMWLWLCRYGGSLADRTNTISLLNNEGSVLHITVVDWEVAWDYLSSEEFYNEFRVERMFRWVRVYEVFTVTAYRRNVYEYEALYHPEHPSEIFPMYNWKQLLEDGTKLEDIKKLLQANKFEFIKDEELVHNNKTYKYKLYEFTYARTVLNTDYPWDEFGEIVNSINCGNFSYGDIMVQYEFHCNCLKTIVWLKET